MDYKDDAVKETALRKDIEEGEHSQDSAWEPHSERAGWYLGQHEAILLQPGAGEDFSMER